MKKTILFAFISGMLLWACNDKNDDNLNHSNLQNSQNLKVDQQLFNDISGDTFQMYDASIIGDSLFIEVGYGGGCGTVDFSLISDGIFMESNPVQTIIRLNLVDEDFCEAYIRGQLAFDLTSLADVYRESYQLEHGIIILHLTGYTGPLIFEF